MRHAALLSIAVAAACSSFEPSDTGPDPTDGGGADAGVDTGASIAAPVFVGSRSQTFAAAPMTVLSPAGVRADDVLVAACLTDPGIEIRLPSGWIEVGNASTGNPFNGGLTTLVIGYHVLSATENADTTYAFEGTSGQIATIAYRNASRQQPLTPATVSSIQSLAVSADRAALDVPPFTTRGVSLSLYVFGIRGSTTYPAIPGLDRVEATSGLAVYRAPAAIPAAATVAEPHLEIPVSSGPPEVLVASLAVAIPP